MDDLRSDTAAIMRGRLADEPEDLPAGAGPLWVGGMAYSPDAPATGPWSSLPPALLTLPELLIARSGSRHLLTLSAVVSGHADPLALRTRLSGRVESLREAALPPLDPHPGPVTVASARPAASYEAAVSAAVERIHAGEFDKLVLAREVQV
nr:isochorismate synthase [Solirubrobacterales bacterium]